ncbi:MAG: valine--tRNA ligase [Candidatus Parcubacteria bacterium]|nr:MAG: valine--tRNA ligase [Candidatus Parcubacteria bacterium]
MPISPLFLKPFDPAEHEEPLYAKWEAAGLFHPETLIEKGLLREDAPPYTIVLPPPNVTGTLHMGHAAMLAIEDVLVRFARMRGYRTLWVPGTDSAAIATQSKVEKQLLKEEGVTRHDLDREAFLERVNAFAKASEQTILNQLRRMGASLDWQRYAYTLDDQRYKAVITAFVRMYEAGLIYRGIRIVNWDPKGQTVVSDDEVEYAEEEAALYTFRYWKDFPIPIATVRPETKVGDVAVAVHPDDSRYQAYIGKTFSGTFAGAELTIRIVADEAVDPEFGTGAVGVTPAHSQTDWEIAERHNLPIVQVIDERGKMTQTAGPLVAGKAVRQAREAIVQWLREEDLLLEEKPIVHRVGRADRTGGIIEPLPKEQWFVSVTKPFILERSEIPGVPAKEPVTLKDIMRLAVEKGGVRILPDRFTKVYFHWIDNLRDWCISRQIWFGHRIPVWYCVAASNPQCKRPIVRATPPEGCPHCGGRVIQDPDTLDTWFSSALWTFSTLGWPDVWDEEQHKAKPGTDLAIYHPTTVLETGYDILFFWVARMILMSGFHLGQVPFYNVYLHGLVRDEKGRKMSKSLGNIIDPLDLIAKYGADAVRLSLVVGVAPGNDIKLSEQRVKGYKHFANKVWNIARFILERTEAFPKDQPLTEEDQTLARERDELLASVTEDLEAFRLHLASEKLYHYTWHRLADEIIEESKPILAGEDASRAASRARLLYETLHKLVRALHPFAPFVTETIWQEGNLGGKEHPWLMTAPWPANEA